MPSAKVQAEAKSLQTEMAARIKAVSTVSSSLRSRKHRTRRRCRLPQYVRLHQWQRHTWRASLKLYTTIIGGKKHIRIITINTYYEKEILVCLIDTWRRNDIHVGSSDDNEIFVGDNFLPTVRQ